MKSLGLIVLGILLIAGVFLLSSLTGGNQVIRPIRTGEQISSFSLMDLQGKRVNISDYAGHDVLINAWATWCPPCRAEMPLLESFYEAHRQEGFSLVAVNAGEAQPTVASFISQNGFSFPVLLDGNTNTLSRLGINSFPTSVLIGPDGTIKATHIGMFTTESLDAEIASQLSTN